MAPKEEVPINNNFEDELVALKTQHESSLAKIDENSSTIAKLKGDVNGLLKKIKEDFTTFKTNTTANHESLETQMKDLKAKMDKKPIDDP